MAKKHTDNVEKKPRELPNELKKAVNTYIYSRFESVDNWKCQDHGQKDVKLSDMHAGDMAYKWKKIVTLAKKHGFEESEMKELVDTIAQRSRTAGHPLTY